MHILFQGYLIFVVLIISIMDMFDNFSIGGMISFYLLSLSFLLSFYYIMLFECSSKNILYEYSHYDLQVYCKLSREAFKSNWTKDLMGI